ncbi:hypothetical protein Val02_09980 [Virgisporangium aliadipatigenens]|uniref:BMP family ABC transporter substrate-binding protein n=1 Tax=Virgisporangium aliadipatigenens TaxID=741659 RepID=A0A8J4DP51_9ACTN|nr:hypothetical protein Val02_09980 [Virgisporangium aliadipatigenens]
MSAAVVLVVAALVAWIRWPHDEPAPPPRAREYLDFTACLLTDAAGVLGADAAPVWAGMQAASAQTRARVQYLAATGATTADDAVPFLNSLAQGGCGVVIGTGTLAVQAIEKGAARFPSVRFVVVGMPLVAPNVTVVTASPDSPVDEAVRKVVVAAVPPAR